MIDIGQWQLSSRTVAVVNAPLDVQLVGYSDLYTL